MSTRSAKGRHPTEAEVYGRRDIILQRGVLPISDDVLKYAACEIGLPDASVVSYADVMRAYKSGRRLRFGPPPSAL